MIRSFDRRLLSARVGPGQRRCLEPGRKRLDDVGPLLKDRDHEGVEKLTDRVGSSAS